jgi:hypothetical protein
MARAIKKHNRCCIFIADCYISARVKAGNVKIPVNPGIHGQETP